MPTKDTGSSTSESPCHCSALMQSTESWNLFSKRWVIQKKVTAIVWFVRFVMLFTNDWTYDFLQVYDKTTALKGLEPNVESRTWQRPTTPCAQASSLMFSYKHVQICLQSTTYVSLIDIMLIYQPFEVQQVVKGKPRDISELVISHFSTIWGKYSTYESLFPPF